MNSGWVTACLPVYKTGWRLQRGIQSVLNQTYANTRVVVSVDGDGADESTKEVLLRFADNPRVRIVYQAAQLGWVGNMNAVFHEADTEYFFYLDHDDYIARDYVERLLRPLVDNPAAINSYGTVEWYGSLPRERVSSPSLVGPKKKRIKKFLGQSLHGYPLFGLTRRSALDQGAQIPPNLCDGLASDIPYVMRLASIGECLLVSEALYYKYRDDHTTSARWATFAPEQQVQAFAHLGTLILKIAYDVLPADEANEVVLGWLPEVSRFALLRSGIANTDLIEVLLRDLILRVALGEKAPQELAFEEFAVIMDDPLVARAQANLKLTEATLHQANQSWLAAAANYEAATRLSPDCAEAHFGLALALEELGLFHRSLAAARTALAIEPNNVDALACISRQSLAIGNIIGAKATAKRGHQLDPREEWPKAILEHIEGHHEQRLVAELHKAPPIKHETYMQRSSRAPEDKVQ